MADGDFSPSFDSAPPYTAASYARLLASYEAYELAELARGAVPIAEHDPIAEHEQRPGGTSAAPGAVLADAVRVLTAAHRLLEAAVVCERLGGADWRLIATVLRLTPHTARERFAAAESRFRARLRRTEAEEDPPEAPWWHALTRAAPLEAALDLDDWVLRHEDGDGEGLGSAPVSRGLARRDPGRHGEGPP